MVPICCTCKPETNHPREVVEAANTILCCSAGALQLYFAFSSSPCAKLLKYPRRINAPRSCPRHSTYQMGQLGKSQNVPEMGSLQGKWGN